MVLDGSAIVLLKAVYAQFQPCLTEAPLFAVVRACDVML